MWVAYVSQVFVLILTENKDHRELAHQFDFVSGKETHRYLNEMKIFGRQGRFGTTIFDWIGHSTVDIYYGQSDVVCIQLRETLSRDLVGFTAWRPDGSVCMQFISEGREVRRGPPWAWGKEDQARSTTDCRFAPVSWFVELMKFEGKDLRAYDFSGAVLSGVDFRGSILDGVRFARAELAIANFEGAQVCNTVFDEAILAEASFSSAQSTGASFKGAVLIQAEFSECLGLQPEQIRQARVWDGAKFPEQGAFDEFRR